MSQYLDPGRQMTRLVSTTCLELTGRPEPASGHRHSNRPDDREVLQITASAATLGVRTHLVQVGGLSVILPLIPTETLRYSCVRVGLFASKLGESGSHVVR
jgi:hypothetical protein